MSDPHCKCGHRKPEHFGMSPHWCTECACGVFRPAAPSPVGTPAPTPLDECAVCFNPASYSRHHMPPSYGHDFVPPSAPTPTRAVANEPVVIEFVRGPFTDDGAPTSETADTPRLCVSCGRESDWLTEGGCCARKGCRPLSDGKWHRTASWGREKAKRLEQIVSVHAAANLRTGSEATYAELLCAAAAALVEIREWEHYSMNVLATARFLLESQPHAATPAPTRAPTSETADTEPTIEDMVNDLDEAAYDAGEAVGFGDASHSSLIQTSDARAASKALLLARLRAASPAPLDALVAEAQADYRAGRTTPMDAPADTPPDSRDAALKELREHGFTEEGAAVALDSHERGVADIQAGRVFDLGSFAAPSQPSEPTADTEESEWEQFYASPYFEQLIERARARISATTAPAQTQEHMPDMRWLIAENARLIEYAGLLERGLSSHEARGTIWGNEGDALDLSTPTPAPADTPPAEAK